VGPIVFLDMAYGVTGDLEAPLTHYLFRSDPIGVTWQLAL
jgi:hypothetical protein